MHNPDRKQAIVTIDIQPNQPLKMVTEGGAIMHSHVVQEITTRGLEIGDKRFIPWESLREFPPRVETYAEELRTDTHSDH